MLRIVPQRFLSRASFSTAAKAAEVDISKASVYDPSSYAPKIHSIVDSISTLSLLEVSDLVKALKSRLNIQDIALPAVAPASGTAAPASAPAAEEEMAKTEQTEFKVILEKFEASAKAKIIREIKSIMPDMNLVQAKKFVESAPVVIKEKVSKEDSEKMRKSLEAVGAVMKIE